MDTIKYYSISSVSSGEDGVKKRPQWFIRHKRTTEIPGSNPTEVVV